MNKTSVLGIVAFLLGVIYSYQAYNLPKASIGNAWAPIYFPLGLGVLMAIVGVFLMIQGWVKEGIHLNLSKDKFKLSYTVKLIIYTSVISILYAILFDRIGYVLSTTLFMGAILFVVNGYKQWKINLLVSFGFSLIIYLAFSKLLGIILPMTPFISF